MPDAKLTPADHARLAATARDGLAALAVLTEEFRRWTHQAAKDYAARFGVDADDLAQAGFARLGPVVRSYTPAHGGLLNYYVYAATRAMTAHARKAGRDRAKADGEAVEWAVVAANPARVERPAAERVAAAVAALKPLEREVLVRMEGYYRPPMQPKNIATELGLTVERVYAICGDAMRAVRAAVDDAHD